MTKLFKQLYGVPFQKTNTLFEMRKCVERPRQTYRPTVGWISWNAVFKILVEFMWKYRLLINYSLNSFTVSGRCLYVGLLVATIQDFTPQCLGDTGLMSRMVNLLTPPLSLRWSEVIGLLLCDRDDCVWMTCLEVMLECGEAGNYMVAQKSKPLHRIFNTDLLYSYRHFVVEID